MKTTHVLGYVGRISQRDLEQIDVSNHAGTSHIGKNGVRRPTSRRCTAQSAWNRSR